MSSLKLRSRKLDELRLLGMPTHPVASLHGFAAVHWDDQGNPCALWSVERGAWTPWVTEEDHTPLFPPPQLDSLARVQRVHLSKSRGDVALCWRIDWTNGTSEQRTTLAIEWIPAETVLDVWIGASSSLEMLTQCALQFTLRGDVHVESKTTLAPYEMQPHPHHTNVCDEERWLTIGGALALTFALLCAGVFVKKKYFTPCQPCQQPTPP